jgi:hypothetical protein
VHAFIQHVDTQRAANHSAQRRRQPQPVIVAAAAVETHDERNVADAIGQRVDVERQVRRTALLARFDHHHRALVRHVLRLQRQQRRKRAEHRIAVIGAATAIELVALKHRDPRSLAFGPSCHLRLLVEVAVEQHSVGALRRAWHIDKDERRPPRQALD